MLENKPDPLNIPDDVVEVLSIISAINEIFIKIEDTMEPYRKSGFRARSKIPKLITESQRRDLRKDLNRLSFEIKSFATFLYQYELYSEREGR